MDEVPGLKLIQAVDPTKIKVTINDKLAKLTLSSNKKKKAAEKLKLTAPVELEKRRSASRNLMDELGDDGEEENQNRKRALGVNAILRSSSLSGEENEYTHQSVTQTQTYNVEIDVLNLTENASMERLQISEDLIEEGTISDDENELEEITQKVSGLAVSDVGNSVVLSPIIIDTSSSEDEESVICVSETSTETNVQNSFNDYNFMVISDAKNSAETECMQLPSTSSHDRADRLEAFLRDVSHERRNMQATGWLPDDVLLHLTSQINNEDNLLSETVKAKMMATADTESMTPANTESNSNKRYSNNNLSPLKQRNIACDDTEPMSESVQVDLLPQDLNISRITNNNIQDDEYVLAKRIANDDTEANTPNSSFEKSHEGDVHAIEDSVIISETSSDDTHISQSPATMTSENQELVPSEDALSKSLGKDSAQHSQIGLSIGSINISARINIKLQIHAEFSAFEEGNETDGNSSPDNSEKSVVNEDETVSSGSINKHAEDTENNDTVSEHYENNCQTNVESSKNQEKVAMNSFTTESTLSKVVSNKNEDSPDNNVNFMSESEKLLTEIYGNSWKTPDVLHTLKKTNASARSKAKLNTKDQKITKKAIRNEINMTEKQKEVEESVLDDFSMFRHDIVLTNLNSTRMATPKVSKKLFSNDVLTEPKVRSKKNFNTDFKMPQTEFKKKSKNTISRTGRPMNERWRQLIDSSSDSDHNNITDDGEVDETVVTDDEEISNASDSSWRKSDENGENSSEDEGYEVPKRNTTNSRNKRDSKVNKKKTKSSSKDRLVYLDLSKEEVTVLGDSPKCSPPANKDENFRKHLSQILDNCRFEDKTKLVATPTSTGKSKRRLFTVSYSDEIIDDSITAICRGETPKKRIPDLIDDENAENVRFNGEAIPRSFNIFNKPLEAIKAGKPVYKSIPKETRTPTAAREEGTPFRSKDKHYYQTPTEKDKRKLEDISSTPSFKYSFLKSLDVCVGKSSCHPDALIFRQNYRQKKEDLAKILYELYNNKVFGNNLNVPLVWNKKLSNTAGRCLNKKKLGQRMSVIELSDKVLTSADRLRCTLIHELCHAATWILDGEGGHGAKWKEWARKANATFPDLPKIGVCHQYDIEYKYTYKCTLCAAKSYYHSKSKKVENIRCSYCYGAIEIFLNKKDKDGNIMPTPVKEPTGFAKFVKEKYQQYKRPDMKHAEVMKLLSNEFAALKVAGNAK